MDIYGEIWYRLKVEFTKLTDTSAKIDVTLTELDEDGTEIAEVVTGQIEDTAALGEDEPHEKYFTGPIWPAYKNYYGAANNLTAGADNAYAEIITDSGSEVQHKGNLNKVVSYKLIQNYPNPFNPSTLIDYQVPEYTNVTITVYSVLGKELRILVNDYKEAGNYQVEWDGRDNEGRRVASGLYFYQMSTVNYQAVKKLIIQK